jgi:hypothetical protein
MFTEEGLEYDNVMVTAEEGRLVLVYRLGENPIFRTRIDAKERGKLIWTMWKTHRKALKWRPTVSQTTEGDGSIRETE